MGDLIRNVLGRMSGKKPLPVPKRTVVQNQAETTEDAWGLLLALNLNREDFLEILSDYRFDKEICTRTGAVLLERYGDSLSIRNLNDIIVYAIGSQVSIDAARLVLDRAIHKDDLGQIIVSKVPGLCVEAARRTLSLNPEPHDILRCLKIPEVAQAALGFLLRDSTPRGHIERAYRDGMFRSEIEAYLKKTKRRIYLPSAARAILGEMRNRNAVQH